MDYRQFNLINDKGETYRLTLANRYAAAFMHDVTGLGKEEAAEFQQIGNVFGLRTDKINQKKINGIIKFFEPYAYQNYLKFALFCQKKPLKLYYRTPSGEFYRDGIVSKIEKSENADSLQANIEFTAMSLWYQAFEVSGTTSVTMLSDSMNASGCHISITGVMNQPTWQQNVDNIVRITGVLENKTLPDGTVLSPAIGDGDTLHIRTDTIPYRIYKTNRHGVETDLYANSRWNTDRFCLIECGENTIACAAASSIKVEGRVEYETV